MATLDLTATHDDGFVIYFGGQPNEVNTYTFANALVAVSDTLRAINQQVNPGYAIELKLEALAEGSFQAKVKERAKSLKDALKFGSVTVLFPVLVAWFYTHVLDPQQVSVEVKTDEVIIQRGDDRIIVPRAAYNTAKKLPKDGRVASEFAKAIEVVESDPHVSSLGLLKDFKGDTPPAILIDRADFAAIRLVANREGGKSRVQPQEAVITILKAVYGKSDRKWDFVWNGVKITAYIKDPVFLADVKTRKYLIGTGDALDVLLEIDQEWDEDANVWLNVSYSVAHVRRFIPGANPEELDFEEPPKSPR